MSSSSTDSPGSSDDPWQPDAMSDLDSPSLSEGVDQVKGGLSKLGKGLMVILSALFVGLLAYLGWRESQSESSIELRKTTEGWVAYDQNTGVYSEPSPTRENALEDLDEVIALSNGDLKLSDETLNDIEKSEGEVEEDKTISHDDLKKELGIE